MKNKKIVLLASDCQSSKWLYNAIIKKFDIERVIIENSISKKTLFRRRIKKIGLLEVVGQTLFSILVVPILKYKAGSRKKELIKEYELNETNFDFTNTKRVSSINDDSCKEILESLNPDIVLVNGTRIISKKILSCTNAIFVNMHVGITPWYRGSHGGYWAIKNNDSSNFGTTIHLVDSGIDTGGILKQVFTTATKKDNFSTYPILQSAIGIAALLDLIPSLLKADYTIIPKTEKGKMYYQPSLWQYFFK